MVQTPEIVVFVVSGVAAVLALIVCILITILCRILYVRRKNKKHQISTSPECSQGTALTTLTTTVSTNDKRYAFSAAGSRRDANNVNSVVKSDTSTTSSNHIRVSDGSASSANSTKAEVVVATATVVEPPVKRVEATNPCSGSAEDNVSADYAEIEEEKTEHKQKVGTLQSAADSTLSTVSSFNSSARGSTLMYNGGQDSFLDNLEPGAHNTPKFPKMASQYDHLAFNTDYEKDPNSVNDHDYEQDPDYQQQKRFDPPLPPTHLYQALKQYPQQSGKETHYNTPEKTLRPLSEKLPRVLGQPDYADAIPHSNSISTPQSRNINYTELRKSTLDPTPHYTHLDVNTKEHTRSSGLSYVTTDL